MNATENSIQAGVGGHSEPVGGQGGRPDAAVPRTSRSDCLDTASARPSVVVVGAGVSGCACATALAGAGLRVTLINSAMDRVGLPAYGPDLIGEDGDWRRLQEALQSVPSPLRGVWLDACARPEGGAPMLNIDRRRISIETKRVLEDVPGLQFRQGFVTDLRVVHAGAEESASGVQVETIFGEVFEGDVVVIAAGLSLGASTAVGAATAEGGRYGEPASEGLRAALGALGADFRRATLVVGPRVAVRDAAVAGWLPEDAGSFASSEGHGVGHEARRVNVLGLTGARLLPVTEDDEVVSWPPGYPPAPHMDRGLRVGWALMSRARGAGGGVAEGREQARACGAEQAPDGCSWPQVLVSPDGVATSELYAAPEGVMALALEPGVCDGDNTTTVVAARMSAVVTADVVAGLSDNGRMWHQGRPASVWVVGRAAGAPDYAASLLSGAVAARDIAGSLGLEVPRELSVETLAGLQPSGRWPASGGSTCERDGAGGAE